MARKSSAESAASQPHHGSNDILGIILLGAAALLLVALLSFHPHDIASDYAPKQKLDVVNWIGPLGAQIANKTFFIFGLPGYLLPFVLLFLGLGCFFEKFSYLRRRWAWTVVMMLAMMGLCERMNSWSLFSHITTRLNCANAGGLIGHEILWKYGFWMLGSVGAPIVYLLIYFISLLYLTNFQLGVWMRSRFGVGGGMVELDPQQAALEKRARDLRKEESACCQAIDPWE